MDTAPSRFELLRGFVARRRFIVSRDELFSLGFQPPQISSWLRSQRLVPVLRGVYSFGRDVNSPEAVLHASLLAAGEESVLTGQTACEVWGIRTPRHRLPRRVEVAVPVGHARRLRGVSPALHQTQVKIVRRGFEVGDLRMMDGLRLVRPGLALIDLAETASAREVRFAFLEACRLGLMDRREVAFCFRRLLGRRGAKKLRPLLSLWVPELSRIRSVFEGLFLLVWIDFGLPMPLVNVKVHGMEVDFYWPGRRFALELDGGAFHNDPAQRQIDVEKTKFLEAKGERVRRLTYKEFDADQVGVASAIARKLGFVK